MKTQVARKDPTQDPRATDPQTEKATRRLERSDREGPRGNERGGSWSCSRKRTARVCLTETFSTYRLEYHYAPNQGSNLGVPCVHGLLPLFRDRILRETRPIPLGQLEQRRDTLHNWIFKSSDPRSRAFIREGGPVNLTRYRNT